jgi:hypothetical protein
VVTGMGDEGTSATAEGASGMTDDRSKRTLTPVLFGVAAPAAAHKEEGKKGTEAGKRAAGEDGRSDPEDTTTTWEHALLHQQPRRLLFADRLLCMDGYCPSLAVRQSRMCLDLVV